MKYLRHKLIFIFSVFILSNFFGQNIINRTKSESSVNKYLSSKCKDYKPIVFGEFFCQNYPNEVQRMLKTSRKVVYSIVHTYFIGDKKQSDLYFHLDLNYDVIGKLSSKEMDKINNDLLKNSGKIDSLINTIDLQKD
jgi:hypothetical protein